ncbi:ornithine cyclodeaminase [Aureimonas endophytica]|uniref:Ornithine cyclodeaminase n=1 Tax=Aureimonas endophytica TaxID=2027858 RepID=A0A917E3Z5_9HYPH|nr:ornithine cyclodeaminase [Aureimonas endophytica]GGE01404.1 ornithine cyclodeaminase [Aureimonas endophytica]
MILIDADALSATLDPRILVEALRAGHLGEVPAVERLYLPEPGAENDLLVWSGWRRREGVVVKAATVFPGNAATGRQNIHSVALLFDGEAGAPLAVIHGEAFTRMKTAADSALAADLLARPDCETLTLIGAGGQAETHARFLLAMRPTIRRVTICNRTPARAEAVAARLGVLGIEAETSADVETAVRRADILSCLTASAVPVFEGDWLAPGAHVDLVGGFTPQMREADDTAIRRARLFADTRRFTLDTCGDFAQAIAAGAMTRDGVAADLFELAEDPARGRRGAEEITLFKNGGGGHLDLMAARALFDLAASSAGR